MVGGGDGGWVDEAVFEEECLSQAGNSPTTYTARRNGPRRESGLFCRAQKRRVAGPIGAAAGRAARCAPRMLRAAAQRRAVLWLSPEATSSAVATAMTRACCRCWLGISGVLNGCVFAEDSRQAIQAARLNRGPPPTTSNRVASTVIRVTRPLMTPRAPPRCKLDCCHSIDRRTRAICACAERRGQERRSSH